MGADEAIAFARAQIGKPYLFGSTGPNTFDCSGLTFRACAAGGVSIGRDTYHQIFDGSEVTRDHLAAGDLIFPDIGHVQLYVGANRVIEAPHTGAFVRETPVWGFWRARRVFASPGTVSSGGVGSVPVQLIGNPVEDAVLAALSKIPVIGQIEGVAKTLNSPIFWRRFGLGLLGAFIVLMGIIFVNRKRIETAGKTAVEVGEVAAAV